MKITNKILTYIILGVYENNFKNLNIYEDIAFERYKQVATFTKHCALG